MGIEAGLAVGLHSSIVELIKSIESHLEAGYHRVKIEIRPGQDIELSAPSASISGTSR